MVFLCLKKKSFQEQSPMAATVQRLLGRAAQGSDGAFSSRAEFIQILK
jgi:hypothetical protein